MKILYLLPSYNLYGGTPKKTLDLMKNFGDKSTLYVYDSGYEEFKLHFEATGANVYEGNYGRNIYRHLIHLIKIIDRENIDIIQTQFSMGETLGFLAKLFRPKIKFVVAFVGPFKPSLVKSLFTGFYYNFVDQFIYITDYVRREKVGQFSILKNKAGIIIFNGTRKREDNNTEVPLMKRAALLDIAGLSEWKNIQVLIEAFNILINIRHRKDVFLYVAGDGPKRKELEALISQYELGDYIHLIGYQSNVGKLLNDCNVFVHPSYAEGFGIVIPEAMLAEKPIIVSGAGALPELIEHGKSGLIVDPHKPEEWADAILSLIDTPELAHSLAKNAKKRAVELFSIEKYCKQYENLYENIINESSNSN
jgi:glycosyltransferase involved in cell wall biosynthesis